MNATNIIQVTLEAMITKLIPVGYSRVIPSWNKVHNVWKSWVQCRKTPLSIFCQQIFWL